MNYYRDSQTDINRSLSFARFFPFAPGKVSQERSGFRGSSAHLGLDNVWRLLNDCQGEEHALRIRTQIPRVIWEAYRNKHLNLGLIPFCSPQNLYHDSEIISFADHYFFSLIRMSTNPFFLFLCEF